jgi:DNA-binding protein YbaB
MANLLKLMQAAKNMQKNVEATQEKLEKMRITGQAGDNNCVTIETTGQHLCTQVTLTEDAKAMSLEALSEAIKTAINQTHTEIKTLSQREFTQLAEEIQNDTEN